MSNSAVNNFINYCTLTAVRLCSAPETTLSTKSQSAPLLITGAFRSGTTITTEILSKAGFDLAPENYLLQGNGPYGHLNPDGFLEDYFFIQLSLYLFKLTNSWGDRPPASSQVAQLREIDFNNDTFRKYALMEIHDDRVNNFRKSQILRKSSVNHIRAYVSNVYGSKPLIKNPHFAVLEPFFKTIFPDSIRVVSFRRPDDWKRSAKALTEKTDAKLYDAYYDYYIANPTQVIFFDLDRLRNAPEDSIKKLLIAVNASDRYSDVLPELIHKKEPTENQVPNSDETRNYALLQSLAVNR